MKKASQKFWKEKGSGKRETRPWHKGTAMEEEKNLRNVLGRVWFSFGEFRVVLKEQVGIEDSGICGGTEVMLSGDGETEQAGEGHSVELLGFKFLYTVTSSRGTTI
jgi:hypothetical protein